MYYIRNVYYRIIKYFNKKVNDTKKISNIDKNILTDYYIQI